MLTSEIKYQGMELSQEFLLAMKVEVTKSWTMSSQIGRAHVW
jgi:hypothetical protein